MNPSTLSNELPSPTLLRWSLLAFVSLFLLLMERAAHWQGRRRARRQLARAAAPPQAKLVERFVHHRPFALLILPLLFWLTACSEAPGAAAPAAPPPATVARPLVRDVPWTRMLPGHIEAIERVSLRSRIRGHVRSLHFREGEQVRKGQLLVRIDDGPHRASLREAEAALARARAEADLAARELERAQQLRARQLIAMAELDRRNAQLSVSRAQVEAAAAGVASARLELGYTQITAPISGRIGRAEISTGNLVGPEDALATLVSDDGVYVRFDIEESVLGRTQLQAWRARFTLPEAPGQVFEGRLAFIDNEVADGTGSIRARVRLDAHPALVPGRYGQVQLQLGQRRDALLVEESALGADQGTRYLLVLAANNTLEYRPVVVGDRVGDLRVVADGLNADDRIVVKGLMRLRPGMTVTPNEIEMPALAMSGTASHARSAE